MAEKTNNNSGSTGLRPDLSDADVAKLFQERFPPRTQEEIKAEDAPREPRVWNYKVGEVVDLEELTERDTGNPMDAAEQTENVDQVRALEGPLSNDTTETSTEPQQEPKGPPPQDEAKGVNGSNIGLQSNDKAQDEVERQETKPQHLEAQTTETTQKPDTEGHEDSAASPQSVQPQQAPEDKGNNGKIQKGDVVMTDETAPPTQGAQTPKDNGQPKPSDVKGGTAPVTQSAQTREGSEKPWPSSQRTSGRHRAGSVWRPRGLPSLPMDDNATKHIQSGLPAVPFDYDYGTTKHTQSGSPGLGEMERYGYGDSYVFGQNSTYIGGSPKLQHQEFNWDNERTKSVQSQQRLQDTAQPSTTQNPYLQPVADDKGQHGGNKGERTTSMKLGELSEKIAVMEEQLSAIQARLDKLEAVQSKDKQRHTQRRPDLVYAEHYNWGERLLVDRSFGLRDGDEYKDEACTIVERGASGSIEMRDESANGAGWKLFYVPETDTKMMEALNRSRRDMRQKVEDNYQAMKTPKGAVVPWQGKRPVKDDMETGLLLCIMRMQAYLMDQKTKSAELKRYLKSAHKLSELDYQQQLNSLTDAANNDFEAAKVWVKGTTQRKQRPDTPSAGSVAGIKKEKLKVEDLDMEADTAMPWENDIRQPDFLQEFLEQEKAMKARREDQQASQGQLDNDTAIPHEPETDKQTMQSQPDNSTSMSRKPHTQAKQSRPVNSTSIPYRLKGDSQAGQRQTADKGTTNEHRASGEGASTSHKRKRESDEEKEAKRPKYRYDRKGKKVGEMMEDIRKGLIDDPELVKDLTDLDKNLSDSDDESGRGGSMEYWDRLNKKNWDQILQAQRERDERRRATKNEQE